MAGRILPANRPRKSPQQQSPSAVPPPAPVPVLTQTTPTWRTGDKVLWNGYRGTFLHETVDDYVETPTADDLVRIDRNHKGKKLSNEEWASKTDPDAKIAKLKDGRPHLAYKPEHAVDLDTGVIVAAVLHPADHGDTTTLKGTLTAAEENLAQVSAAPTKDKPGELVADKGYHSRAILKDLDGGAWKTRIAE